MATNNIQVKCDFTAAFAKCSTIEELRFVANDICEQVKEAFGIRSKEIKQGEKKGVTIKVVENKQKTEVSKQADKKNKPNSPKETTAKKQNKETKVERTVEVDNETLISITDTEAIKKLGLTFERYNDKCWVLRGNTKPLRKVLKELFKGVYNSHLNGGEGWVFRTASVPECANALGLSVKVA